MLYFSVSAIIKHTAGIRVEYRRLIKLFDIIQEPTYSEKSKTDALISKVQENDV